MQDYHKFVTTTFVSCPLIPDLALAWLQLLEEVGELMEAIVEDAPTQVIKSELGDVLYWFALIGNQLNWSLPDSSKVDDLGSAFKPMLPILLGATGIVKRIFRDDQGVLTYARRGLLLTELELAYYHFVSLCAMYGYTPEAIAKGNMQKLNRRLEQGTIVGEGDR